MQALIEARGVLIAGIYLTIQLFFCSALIAVVASILAGTLQHSSIRAVRWMTTIYVEVFRGTSVVVQMFWIYFALPSLGIRFEPFETAVIALGLCFGAYGSEVVRGAIASVPKEQYEATIALSMSVRDKYFRVIYPQALVSALPPYTNILVLLLKSTSAASLITIPELTFRANSLNQVTFQTTWIFGSVLIAYFLMATCVTFSMRQLEQRLSRWRLSAH